VNDHPSRTRAEVRRRRRRGPQAQFRMIHTGRFGKIDLNMSGQWSGTAELLRDPRLTGRQYLVRLLDEGAHPVSQDGQAPAAQDRGRARIQREARQGSARGAPRAFAAHTDVRWLRRRLKRTKACNALCKQSQDDVRSRKTSVIVDLLMAECCVRQCWRGRQSLQQRRQFPPDFSPHGSNVRQSTRAIAFNEAGGESRMVARVMGAREAHARRQG